MTNVVQIETSPLFGRLGDAVRSLSTVPASFLVQDLEAIRTTDEHDNETLTYGPDTRGLMYAIGHQRKRNWSLRHDCCATVSVYQVQAPNPTSVDIGRPTTAQQIERSLEADLAAVASVTAANPAVSLSHCTGTTAQLRAIQGSAPAASYYPQLPPLDPQPPVCPIGCSSAKGAEPSLVSGDPQTRPDQFRAQTGEWLSPWILHGTD